MMLEDTSSQASLQGRSAAGKQHSYKQQCPTGVHKPYQQQ
jgi:hypothetical protein